MRQNPKCQKAKKPKAKTGLTMGGEIVILMHPLTPRMQTKRAAAMTNLPMSDLTRRRGGFLFIQNRNGGMMIRSLLILILVCSAAAFAQPQAPVEWGEVRWLGIENAPSTLQPAILMGDTLILAGAVSDGQTPPHYCPAVIYSFDNGLTFGPWHCLDSALYVDQGVHMKLFGSRGLAFARVNGRVERSTDAGVTWEVNRPRPQYGRIDWGTMSRSLVITVEWVMPPSQPIAYSAALSDDGGDSWRTGIPLPTEIPESVEFLDLAVTQNHILLHGDPVGTSGPLLVAVGSLHGESWSRFVELAGPPLWNANPSFIRGDSTSEVAMVGQPVEVVTWNVADLYLNRSTDGGLSWDSARNLSGEHQLCGVCSFPEIFCRGKLWGVVWEDFWNPDTTQWGVYTRLSANHGKDWYPEQALGLDCPGMSYSGGQFVGNEVRLYWIVARFDYATVTGVLTPDTMPPVVNIEAIPNEVVHAGDALQFAIAVTENDTLSRVRLMIKELSGDTVALPMAHEGGNAYATAWTVPDTGYFDYWFEAEDFWENIGVAPDSGTYHFVTEGWNAADDVNARSESFSITIYPNPSNTWPRIELAGEWFQNGVVRVAIFDILGRRIWEDDVRDYRTAITPHVVTATGIYFVRAAAKERAVMKKFLVVK